MNTRVPVPIRPTRNGEGVELFINQKLRWDKTMTEYIKCETKLDEKCHKSYALIFGKCTEQMHSKIKT